MNDETAIWQKIESGLRGSVPLLLTFTLLIICILPLGVPGLSMVMPALPLMAIYFWTVFRPDLMPLAVAFLIGILQDVLSGTPIGMSAAVYVAVHAVMVGQRRLFHGKSFMLLWAGFAIVAFGATLLGWVLATAYFGALPAARPVLFQLLLTVAFYPCVAWLLGVVRRDVLRPA